MRTLLLSGLALTALAMLPAPAMADIAQDRSAAIRLCRAEAARQAGVGLEQVRFDEIRTRARRFMVDLDLWRDGRLTNVRCIVERGAALSIASVTPALRAGP